ncbi:MAG: hypothetical protein ACR2JK_02920 [Geodermatophilaceae bacterium]
MTTANSTLGRRRSLLLAAGLIAMSTLWAPVPAHAGACSGGSGVTVVVDFGRYGGIQTGCASDPTNGLSALSQAGFSSVHVTSQPGFVCRIDGLPPAEDDACVRTPPATAYWSYWQASPGSTSWTYSSQSAASTQPQDGGTEGWAFGGTTQPGVAPPVNTTAPPPPPPPPPPPEATSSRPAPAPLPAGTPTRSGDSAPPASTTAGGSVPSDVPDGSAVPTPPGTTSGHPTAGAESSESSGGPSTGSVEAAAGITAAATDTDVGGAPWGAVIAVVVSAALGAGAYWQIRQRR